MKKVLLIGGPGNISASTLDSLVLHGCRVGLFSKPTSRFDEVNPQVQIFPGDRDSFNALEEVIQRFQPDVIIDMVCFLPEQARQIADLLDGKLEQFIFVSTVDVYGFPLTCLPMKETDPWQEKANSEYAEKKRQCEQVFKEKASSSKFPLTIVRPGYSFSERFIISALSRSAAMDLLYRLQNEMPLLAPGDGRTLVHVSSGYNTGRMVAALVGNANAMDREYTLASPSAMEYIDYLRLFAGVLGKEPVLVNIPSQLILSLQHPDLWGNLLEELMQYNLSFSIARFLSDCPDFEFEPLKMAAQRAVEWNLKNDLVYKPNIEDWLISAYQSCLAKFSL
jgi:nucleoside-diphosphate-sugar epimerase